MRYLRLWVKRRRGETEADLPREGRARALSEDDTAEFLARRAATSRLKLTRARTDPQALKNVNSKDVKD
eukprot:473944-Prymnesium_polylepis.1